MATSWTFTYIGSQGSLVVPGGVTQLQIECWGAGGQRAGGVAGDPGKGGYVKATIPTTPGETLYINVGGSTQGWNGGGNSSTGGPSGGGMSDVRQGGSGTGNIVVVGGGGGGPDGNHNLDGGAGGNPGLDGEGAQKGHGATQSSGGAATSPSTAGSAFQGGNGTSGGGGGGYYGGGAGGGGGGGGGSGAASRAGATAFNVLYTTSAQSGNGAVKITVPAPPSPTLITPNSGSSLNASGAVALAWTYNQSAAGTTQLSYQCRRKIGAGAYSYLTAPNNWASSTPVNNTSAAGTISPTGWSNGNTWNWSIATTDSNGLGAFANDFTFVASSTPSVSVTAPTGTATTDPVAHGAWTPTTPAGSQTAYRAVVYNAAQYGAGGFAPGAGPSAWDSGVVGASTAAANSAVLVNAVYRFYVQITQTGGQASAWAFSAFTISTTPPTTPTLGAASDPSNASTTLTVFATAATIATIQYNDDGVTWLPVRNGTGLTVGGGGYVSEYDYEAPPLATRNYRAMVSTTLLVPSAWSTTVPVSNQTPGFWLKDPTTPLSGLRVMVLKGSLASHFPEQLTEPQGLGNAAATIVADVIGLEDGGATFVTMSAADEATLMGLLLTQKTLLFQTSDGRAWYIRITSARPTDQPYVVLPGMYRAHVVTWR